MRTDPDRLSDDVALLGRIVWTPAEAFATLADDRVRAVGFVVPVLAGVARLLYDGRHEAFGVLGSIGLLLVTTAVVLPLWAAAVRAVMRAFRRDISFARVLNLGNYTQVPRLGASLGLLAAEPIGNTFGPNAGLALVVAVFAALGLSVVLYVRGLAALSTRAER